MTVNGFLLYLLVYSCSFPLPRFFNNKKLIQVQGDSFASQLKLAFKSHTHKTVYPLKKKLPRPPHLTAEQTVTHPLPSKNIQSHLIPREKGEGKEKKKKRECFKFRPTVNFGLAAFPHAPHTLNLSTTPSSAVTLPFRPQRGAPDFLFTSDPSLTPPLPLSGSPPNSRANEAGCKHSERTKER